MNNGVIKGISIWTLFFSCNAFAQTLKTFQGNYENGTATYQYYENQNFERVFQGQFKYKGIVTGGVRGTSMFYAVGQYNQDKKDGKWSYVLADPDIKGTYETVSGLYSNGQMTDLWTSTTTLNLTKKTIRKTSANFKNNKLAGELKFDYNINNLKDFSSISISGFFNDSSYFEGTWSTTYTQGNIQYEESRKYRNGVLYFLLHRRLSDGKILEKIDSTFFVDQFFQHYDASKQTAQIGNQRYIFKDKPDKYSGSLELPIVVSDYWTKTMPNPSFSSLININPAFMIERGHKPTDKFHENIVTNWASTQEGAKQTWQEEQNKKLREEKFNSNLSNADTAFSKKQYTEAVEFYKQALAIKETQYIHDQIQKAQLIIDQRQKELEREQMAKEQEKLAKEKTYKNYIAKADSNFKDEKLEIALEFYKSALEIKDDNYPKSQIEAIRQLNNETLRLQTVNEIDRNWVTVEGGSYKMGCFRTDEQALKNEEPTHEVYISTFKISKFEVTNGQYKAFCKVKGLKESQGPDSVPATNISWNDAVAFADWLGCRLPTEAEWEYAARGGIKNKKYLFSGSNQIEEVAWFSENASNMAHAVGQKTPNILGIYDMTGNVWEWCNDWYGDYSENKDIDPKGPATGVRRVKRGGSFSDTNFEVELRITYRGSEPPDFSSYNLGLRLVKK